MRTEGEYLPQWHPWEDYRRSYAARADLGGGVIVTLTHPLDYLRYLLGEIDSLWSFNGHLSLLEIDVEDAAEIGLKFASGAVGGVHVNYFQRPPVHRLEIVGPEGTLRWDNADGNLHLYKMPAPFGSFSDNPPAPVVESFSPPEGSERNQLFLAQTRHLIGIMRGESEPVCRLEDGIMALRLALAVKESMSSGRRIDLTQVTGYTVQFNPMSSRRFNTFAEIILMLVISALVYLPFINQFGYYADDWYSMYAARVAGTDAFHEMYSIDRPGRAYVMAPLYQLFQGNPLHYSISAYVLRVLGALSLLWLLRLIWPRQRQQTLLVALLFVIYPGFLSMPNAIDFQSHLVGIFLAFVSLSLGVYAFSQPVGAKWAACWLGAVLTGWAYLSQMEYYIGFEAVRLLLFLLLAHRSDPRWGTALGNALKRWLPFSIIPLGYLVWRVFNFNNERATEQLPVLLLRSGHGSLSARGLCIWQNRHRRIPPQPHRPG